MKKSTYLTFFGIACITLCACTSPATKKDAKPYDLAVIDDVTITSFKEVDGELKKVEQKKLSGKSMMLNNIDFFDDGRFVYGTTARENYVANFMSWTRRS